jgi:hypothetical protein
MSQQNSLADPVQLVQDLVLIDSKQLRSIVGGKSAMTVWRWGRLLDDPLPDPITINGRNYWRLCEIRKWLERRAELAASESNR